MEQRGRHQEQSTSDWNSIPLEIVTLISEYLFPTHRTACVRVSKAWFNLWTPELWRIVVLVLPRQFERFASSATQAALERHGHFIRIFVTNDNSRRYGFLLGTNAMGCTQIQELSLNFNLPHHGHHSGHSHSTYAHTSELSNFEIVMALLERNPGLRRISLQGYYNRKTSTESTPPSEALKQQDLLEALPYERLESLDLMAFSLRKKAIVPQPHQGSGVQQPVFKQLKRLYLSGNLQEEQTKILRFLSRCVNLETIHLEELVNVDFDALTTQLRQHCPNLKELRWDEEEYSSTDRKIAQVLSSSSSGWRRLHIPVMMGFGELSFQALMQHAETLESLEAESLLQMTDGTFVQRFLERATVLRHLKGTTMDHTQSFSRDMVIDTSDLYDPEHPTPTRKARPWACAKTLEKFQALICGIPRWDILYRREGQPLELEPDLRGSKEECLLMERRAYRQIGALTCLQELCLGHPDVLSGPCLDLDDYEDQWDQDLSEAVIVRPFQYWCLSFSLDSGLELLKELKNLRKLDVTWLAHKIGVPELEWMHENWPQLKEIGGLIGPRGWADEDWQSRTAEVEQWIEAHPKGIGRSFYVATRNEN
ncbi:hypothetical protein BGZ83_006404 [Gryganskiella cystojenkinii]|nr:hypothetical protein BGZ83_006404 [Gryganskiella cystojenkinii]